MGIMPAGWELFVRKWTPSEIAYLLDHFRKDGVKAVAEHLGRKPISVYKKLYALGIHVSRKWTVKELEYLEDVYERVTPEMIAKQLFRTVNAVYCKMSELGLRILEKEELTIKNVAKQLKVSVYYIRTAVDSGKLKYACKSKSKNGYVTLDELKLQQYFVEHDPFKVLHCLQCGQETRGCIFCKLHMPQSFPRPEKKEINYILNPKSAAFRKELGRIFAKQRKIMGLSQEQVADGVGYALNWYGRIELGKVILDFEKVTSICQFLNLSATLTVRSHEPPSSVNKV